MGAVSGGETREEALVHIENMPLMILKEMETDGASPPPDMVIPGGIPLTIESGSGPMTAFTMCIGIDYSGAQTPTTSLKGRRVYPAKGDDPPVEVLPPRTYAGIP